MISLTVNGKQKNLDTDKDMPLLWVLRDVLGLKGTKFGCGQGLCGSCTVHLDGKAVRSCQTPLASVEGRTVTTIEGLSTDGSHPCQVAWRGEKVPQCGYCQPGQIMNAAAFLAETPSPSEPQIEKAMAGNLCRCGTYGRIKKAIRVASGSVK
ncbi:MAG: (2Fe-2S)-binding protein [Elusimicrobia bacterium]|nr:MAG: (2Fe-2S)-binding protein [Elusimicrobiota bacterium]